MSITDFATYVIKNIVKNPEMVKVSSFQGDEDETILEVIVASEDMGAVIGKQGKNAKAIRTLIQAHAYLNDIKRVKVNIDSF